MTRQDEALFAIHQLKEDLRSHDTTGAVQDLEWRMDVVEEELKRAAGDRRALLADLQEIDRTIEDIKERLNWLSEPPLAMSFGERLKATLRLVFRGGTL